MLGRSEDVGVLLDGCSGRLAGVVCAGVDDDPELAGTGPGVVGCAGEEDRTGAVCGFSPLLVGEAALGSSVEDWGSLTTSADFGVGLSGDVELVLVTLGAGTLAAESGKAEGTCSPRSDWDDGR